MDSIFNLIWSFKRLQLYLLFIHFPRLEVKHVIIFLKPKEALLLCHFHMFSSASATYVSASRILHPLPDIIKMTAFFFLHLLWIPGLICWCKSGYDATLLFFLSRTVVYRENPQQSVTCKLVCFFAGRHDLGVQKHKVSKEMTQEEKDGRRTAVAL